MFRKPSKFAPQFRYIVLHNDEVTPLAGFTNLEAAGDWAEANIMTYSPVAVVYDAERCCTFTISKATNPSRN